MQRLLILSAVTLLFGVSGVGCSHTAEGVKQDADNAGPVVRAGAEHLAQVTRQVADNADKALSNSAENAGPELKRAEKNSAAALEVTPSVKAAIIADSRLNNKRNRINVDSADNIVHLKGHVLSEQMKQRAGKIAQRTLNKGHFTAKLSNELAIQQ